MKRRSIISIILERRKTMIYRTRQHDIRRLISLLLSGISGVWLMSITSGHAEMNPKMENTTGPISGLTVQAPQNAKEYRVLWPGHRIVIGTVDST